MKWTEVVIQDHVVFRRGLDVLDGMVKKLENGERIETADAGTILKFLRLFVVENKQTFEKNVLFPALLRAGVQENPIRQMLFEHSEQRTLVSAVDEALRLKKGTEFVRSARGLSALLRNHMDREEDVLRSAEAVSSVQDNHAEAEFMKQRKPSEDDAAICRLEGKYARKHQPPLTGASRDFSRGRGWARPLG